MNGLTITSYNYPVDQAIKSEAINLVTALNERFLYSVNFSAWPTKITRI